MNTVFEGLILGLAYASPIGAQNIFVINSVSGGGVKNATKVAITVAIMDVTLALACFLGMGIFLSSFPILKPVMSAFGALFLFWFGFSLLNNRSHESDNIRKTRLSLSTLIKTSFVNLAQPTGFD